MSKKIYKISKCKDQEIEIEKLRQPKTTTVLVILGALERK